MNIEIIRSKRKTISIEIKRDARIIVRAPKKMNQTDIDKFIVDKSISAALNPAKRRYSRSPMKK